MHLYFVIALVIFNIEVSRECALPFWWRDQFRFTPENPTGLTPKRTYSFRSSIHHADPNNFVHIQQYSEFTWWEHDSSKQHRLSAEAVPGTSNVAYVNDDSINGISPGKRHHLLSSVNGIKGVISRADSSINGMVPRRKVTNGMVSEDSETNKMTPGDDSINGIIPSDADTNRMVTKSSDTNGSFNRDDDATETFTEEASNEIFSESTSGTTTTTEAAKTTTEVSNTITEVSSTTETTSTTTTEAALEREPLSPERERNEKEDFEVSKSENLEANDLETSGASKSSSELKVKEPHSRGKFFGGWFGHRTGNESEPCKVTETDIHSLRSMIEKMFSKPREHVTNADSKEKAREDILNKFRNYGLQVWTQNFTTPAMMNSNGTEEFNEGVNLIGVIPGSQRGRLDDEIVLVGAHYDTVADSNGVDDNGSGLAVMLEVARAITEARCRLNNTLMFVAFDHEENGAMGSNYFVDNYLIPEELKRARARFQGAFILDGIMNYNDIPNTQELPLDYTESLPGFEYFVNNTGNRGNFLAMISRNEMDNHLSKKLMDAWQDLGDHQYKLFNLAVNMGNTIPTPSIVQKHLNFLRSDHATFWYHNSSSHFPDSLNAVLLTDTGPFRGQMKECYHSKCDDLTVITPEKLQFAKKTADALTATLVELTSATATGSQLYARWLNYALHIAAVFYITKALRPE